MAKSIKDHLQDALSNIGADNLRRFQSRLGDRKQEPRVRKSTIEKLKDEIDLVDLLVNTFTSDAVSVTVDILRGIKCNAVAEELLENTGQGGVSQPEPPVPEPIPKDPAQLKELKVTPCSQQFKNKILREKGQETYEIKDKSVRKRLALLINNVDFDDKAMKRSGSEKDEENMEKLLKELDYQVVKRPNLSAKEMDEAIRDFAQREEHKYSDSAFVVIMSHGKRDAIMGVHYHRTNNPSDSFPVDNVYRRLNSENCPALRDKPKVILIQACRGGEHGRVWASDGEPDEPIEIEDDDFVHKEKDFISLMSCTPDTKSYRHVQNGTFYVQTLVDVFIKCAHEDHIEELFRKVLRRFEHPNMIGNFKQMACKDRATLPKLFYLFPGL
ncbi:caspase a [Danio rerio]|uniref:Caspase a n=4 Tax=Danio rerio TaxID=7955 RepID=CASPA_DANRE|nr:caspase a [Danio rerio]Q9I9L7.1 RecName: Full=Caspase a; Contains: RecName: Full=Caspase a subunit p20; Contains: RecName: Full=Caspase a subunit p10; Flags: Precursor [Danio rerio]AAF66964.1 caspase [Danio rerio]AAH95022.1 Caspase a [Danio rerio]AAI64780.1 Caspa protein [Danio rerio]|eukprot:NP_571580.1 caspase-1 [Danio rerio]